MDTNNQFTAGKTTTSFNPANIETDQESTGLNKRGSAAGRPVETVSTQASVRTDTAITELPVSLQNMSIMPITADQTLRSQQTEPEATPDTSSAHSAGSEEPVMSNPAITDTDTDTEQPSPMEQISDLITCFHRDPSESKFRKLEQLIDQYVDPEHERKMLFA